MSTNLPEIFDANRNDLNNKYRGVLLANHPFIETAVNFAVDFGKIDARDDYLHPWYFAEYIEENQASLRELAPKIHDDLIFYWTRALYMLGQDHEEAVKEYTKIAYSTGKKKAERKPGAPRIEFAHLNLAHKDVLRALKSLGRFKMTAPEDVNRWKDLSLRSSTTIIRTHSVHQTVLALIEAKDRAKSEILRAAGGALLKVTSTAISIAKVAHAIPP